MDPSDDLEPTAATPPDPDASDAPPADVPSEFYGLGYVARAVEEASRKIDADREAQEERIAASVRKFRVWRFAGIVGLVLAFVSMPLGGIALWSIHQANHERAQNRVTSCRAYNDDLVTNVNALNDKVQGVLRSALAANPAATDQSRSFVDGQLAEFEKVKVPERDCSPAGIVAYYRDR